MGQRVKLMMAKHTPLTPQDKITFIKNQNKSYFPIANLLLQFQIPVMKQLYVTEIRVLCAPDGFNGYLPATNWEKQGKRN